MKDTTASRHATRSRPAQLGMIDRTARKSVRSQLRSLREGHITLIDETDTFQFGQPGTEVSLAVTVTVHDPRFYRLMLFGGGLGAAEAYIRQYWSCDDLTKVFRIFLLNMAVGDSMERGAARILAPFARVYHWLRRNTKLGSRKNIHAHYDLGNEFFSLFLDDTMTYSCGIYETSESTLQDAQIAKIDRICRKLDLRPDDHILEIGAGWGSCAIHASKQYGCRITTTTISMEQHALAIQRVKDAGLDHRVDVLFTDYRDLEGQFNKLISIEMIEAVGHEYLDTYFRKCSELLKPDGTMAIQAIVIGDQRYDGYRRSVDFIRKYIFPGGHLPCISAILDSVRRATDMRLFHHEDITPHYARTLREWRDRFFGNLDRVRELGYPDSFIRMWNYYLCYCEAGFEERHVGVVQMVFAKPNCRRDPILPPLETRDQV